MSATAVSSSISPCAPSFMIAWGSGPTSPPLDPRRTDAGADGYGAAALFILKVGLGEG